MNNGWICYLLVAAIAVAVALWKRRSAKAPVKAAESEEGDGRELFRREMADLFRSGSLFTSVEPGDDYSLILGRADGTTRTVFLENIYIETRDVSPEDRRHRITRFMLAMGEAARVEAKSESFSDVKGSFVPVLRGASFGVQLWAGEEGASMVRQPFLPYVDTFIAVDRENSMSYVTRGQLDGWKVGEEEVLAAAWARIGLLDKPKMKSYGNKHGPVWMVASDDSYEAARLLVPGWLASFRGKVEGTPIAIVPERATLLVGGDQRPELIAWLLDKAARDFEASPRRISAALYTVDESGKVVPYVRAGTDELAKRLRVAQEKVALSEYADQKAALEKVHAEKGPDVFVATYKAIIAPDGSVHSTSAWVEGVPSWLPRTDHVALVRPAPEGSGKKADIKTVPWEAVADRFTARSGTFPTLYETGAYPTVEEAVGLPAA